MNITFATDSTNAASNGAPGGSLTSLHLGSRAAPASSTLHVNGDTVSISAAAKTLASTLKASPAVTAAGTVNQAQQNITTNITALQTQLNAAQSNASLTPEQKAQRVETIQTELLMLMNEQVRLGSGASFAGGTPTVGIGNSVSAFLS